MPRRLKKPKQSAKGQRYAYPIPDNSSPMAGRPLFSFHYLQASYCISQCTRDEKASFADKMRLLSKLTWNQIIAAPSHGLGSEIIPRHRFKVAIPQTITDDEELIAIRFCGNAPMVGVRRRDIFHIIWFDRNFTVYEHGN